MKTINLELTMAQYDALMSLIENYNSEHDKVPVSKTILSRIYNKLRLFRYFDFK